MNKENAIVLFKEKTIRRAWHKEEWWFVIVDVVAALTDSEQPTGYIKDMRRRDPELAKGWGQIATPLEVETPGGRQKVNCANTEGILRIIQSIPSPKAEPVQIRCSVQKAKRGSSIQQIAPNGAIRNKLVQLVQFENSWCNWCN